MKGLIKNSFQQILPSSNINKGMMVIGKESFRNRNNRTLLKSNLEESKGGCFSSRNPSDNKGELR